MTCNRCHEALLAHQAVEPSFSGRYPYVHADPADCRVLRAERRSSGPVPPIRLVRDIEPEDD